MGSKLSGCLYIRTLEQLSHVHTLWTSDCREHDGPVVPTAACKTRHRFHAKHSHRLPPANDEQGDQGLHLSLRTSWKPFWAHLNFLCSLRHSHMPFPPFFSPFPGVGLALRPVVWSLRHPLGCLCLFKSFLHTLLTQFCLGMFLTWPELSQQLNFTSHLIFCT